MTNVHRVFGLVVASMLGTLVTSSAYADEPEPASPATEKPTEQPSGEAETTPLTGAAPPSTGPAAPPAPAAPTPEDPAYYAKIDALSEPGLSIVYPGAYDSITQDAGGWRSALAKHDISFTFRGSAVFNFDTLQLNKPATPQVYAGQKLTAQSESAYFVLTAGLRDIGLPDTKIVVGGIVFGTSWKASQGPSQAIPKFDKLAIAQSLFDKRVELKVGYLVNYLEFIGVFTGGSPLLATGLSSLVPIEAGLSADPAPSPTANLTINGPAGTYFKGGIQRSTTPLGQEYEARHDGPVNLDFSMPRAKELYIGELGIHRQASDETNNLWARAGGMYNTSEFASFRDGTYKDNWLGFGLVDYQILKPYPGMAYRGLYVGASIFVANPLVTAYSQYYENRIYGVGLIPSRPADSITFGVNHSVTTQALRDSLKRQGVNTAEGQTQVNASYSWHAVRGLYVAPNLSWVRHPAIGEYDDALVVGLNLFANL